MNLAERLHTALEPERARLLREAGAIASRLGPLLYLVGGSVRDLLLARPVLDLDLVVEGDAPVLAHQLARHLSGQVVAWSQFRTAKVKIGSLALDLATARIETYARPGALPSVKPGTIRDDLLRRDFTINALAVDLSPEGYGEVLDLTNGVEDLRSGLVRVLHDNSFRDDATRILRAVRYEQRLGFQLEPHTERLLRRDLPYLDTISPDRVRHELERTLEEADPARPLLRAADLGALEAVHPALRAVGGHRAFLEATHSQKQASPLLYLAVLAWAVPPEAAEGLVRRLNLTARQARVVRDTQLIKELTERLASPGLRPSQAYDLLRDLAPEAAQAGALALAEGAAQGRLQQYVDQWRRVRPTLTGHDLLRLGVPQGPLVGQLLDELRRARLDGQVSSRADEEALVKRRMEGGWNPFAESQEQPQ